MTIRHLKPVLATCFGLLVAWTNNAQAVTFQEALDTSGLTWTTGGNANWIATNASATPTFDAQDAAVSGTITHNQETWLQTTVTGPGTLSFWWSVSSDDGEGIGIGDWLEFYIDGEFQEGISGDVFPIWQYAQFNITNGAHTVRWRYVKDDDINYAPDQGYLDQVKFISGTPPPLAQALNTPYYVWSTGGNVNPTYWNSQTNVFRADGLAAESGAITHLQTNWMQTTVVGVTNVSFWWKVSSEQSYDLLAFYVNGVEKFSISGEVNWQQKTNIALSGPTNTLRWAYFKDDTDFFSIGQNRGWVDEVTFSPAVVPGASIVLGAPTITNGQAQFALNYAAGWPVNVFYSTNLGSTNWSTLLSTNTTSATTIILDAGATNSPGSRFYRAAAPVYPATIFQ